MKNLYFTEESKKVGCRHFQPGEGLVGAFSVIVQIHRWIVLQH